jgi:hypothetical protein
MLEPPARTELLVLVAAVARGHDAIGAGAAELVGDGPALDATDRSRAEAEALREARDVEQLVRGSCR